MEPFGGRIGAPFVVKTCTVFEALECDPLLTHQDVAQRRCWLVVVVGAGSIATSVRHVNAQAR